MLVHHEVYLEASYKETHYIPFAGTYPGSERDRHVVRLGHEGDVQHAIEYALSVFPLAKVTAVWETTILGTKIKQVWKQND